MSNKKQRRAGKVSAVARGITNSKRNNRMTGRKFSISEAAAFKGAHLESLGALSMFFGLAPANCAGLSLDVKPVKHNAFWNPESDVIHQESIWPVVVTQGCLKCAEAFLGADGLL